VLGSDFRSVGHEFEGVDCFAVNPEND